MKTTDRISGDYPFLHRFIAEEFLTALGIDAQSIFRIPLRLLIWIPTRVFVHLGAKFDQQVAQVGFDGAAKWILPRFVAKVEVSGIENIPTQGPLIIAANHPGNIDSLTLIANLPRRDFKILALDIAFIQGLPNLSGYFIYSTENNSSGRMLAVRASIRHLQAGGALIIFPYGHVSPDPAVLPGAIDTLDSWSKSLELFLRKVPQTKIQLVAISHIATHRFFDNRISRRLHGISRQILSQHLQFTYQMLRPGRFLINPKLSFAKPLTYTQLQSGMKVHQAIVEQAKNHLRTHIQKYNSHH